MRRMLVVALTLPVGGCAPFWDQTRPDAAALCRGLTDEAGRAAGALVRPHTPDDVVEDVEPFVSGFYAGCGE